MWSACTVRKVIMPSQDDELKMLETGDFRLLQNKYQVWFDSLADPKEARAVVPLDYIRLSKTQMADNQLKRQETERKEDILPTEFVVPENLKVRQTDNEKVRQQKQKKLKALKQHHTLELHNQAATQKQNSWLSFQSKAIKKQKESIFKSSETKPAYLRK